MPGSTELAPVDQHHPTWHRLDLTHASAIVRRGQVNPVSRQGGADAMGHNRAFPDTDDLTACAFRAHQVGRRRGENRCRASRRRCGCPASGDRFRSTRDGRYSVNRSLVLTQTRRHIQRLRHRHLYLARLTSTCGTNIPRRSLRGVAPTRVIVSVLLATIFHLCSARSLIELVARSFRTQMIPSPSSTV